MDGCVGYLMIAIARAITATTRAAAVIQLPTRAAFSLRQAASFASRAAALATRICADARIEPIARQALFLFGPNMSGETLVNVIFAEVIELLHGASL